MRSVINISLPASLYQVVEEEVEKGKYASKSEFFRNLLRMWTEGRLLNELERSRDEIKKGKAKFLKSLSDLRQ
jgi:Arc/MetJ-type ribon-helix-helix transcriptional regulator